MLNIRKKDMVLVIAGKDKGKKGEVLKLLPAKSRVIVSKINMVTKHRRAQGGQPGGLQKLEAPLHLSNLMLMCPKCKQPMRPKRDVLTSGEKVRLCRKCGEVIL
ncbi:MAG: 50S ribosomal protein L24 [Elusimicrobia bacterium RIFCSPLOWO2_12_FULL_59_9]|nr:MAG: 50S ribosomal protein L24 [Elusimicrobia bacterium RIFCSPLOWO2_12_FULL_59_9]